jgi:hypothetical protein
LQQRKFHVAQHGMKDEVEGNGYLWKSFL